MIKTSNETVMYSQFYSENINDFVRTGKILRSDLKRRKEKIEAGVT